MIKSMEDWEREFQSILFAGYCTKAADPATLFRMMTNDAVRLRERLANFAADVLGTYQQPLPVKVLPPVKPPVAAPARASLPSANGVKSESR